MVASASVGMVRVATLTTLAALLLVNVQRMGADECGGVDFRRLVSGMAITMLVVAGVSLVLNVGCLLLCIPFAWDASAECFPISVMTLGTYVSFQNLFPLVIVGGLASWRVFGDGRWSAYLHGTLVRCPEEPYGVIGKTMIAFWPLLLVIGVPDGFVAAKITPM